MHKDELLELHEQMVIIKDNFAARGEVDESIFDEYETLGGVGGRRREQALSRGRPAIEPRIGRTAPRTT